LRPLLWTLFSLESLAEALAALVDAKGRRGLDAARDRNPRGTPQRPAAGIARVAESPKVDP
jgi:hypothetical protein